MKSWGMENIWNTDPKSNPHPLECATTDRENTRLNFVHEIGKWELKKKD